MRFAIGFATVWAALAIWRRVPPFPDLSCDEGEWR